MNISVMGKGEILENININEIVYVKLKTKRTDISGNVLMTASGDIYTHSYGDELIKTIEKFVNREFIWCNLDEYIDMSLIEAVDTYMRRIVITLPLQDGTTHINGSAGMMRVLIEKGYKELRL
jgi:hypothetical protein